MFALSNAVSFQNISKTYATPRGELHALRSVSFDIEEGEFFGSLGPSTGRQNPPLSVLAGLAKATGGVRACMGHDVQADYQAARRALGVVPQELVFDPFFTVRASVSIPVRATLVSGNNDSWIDELLHSLGGDRQKQRPNTAPTLRRMKRAACRAGFWCTSHKSSCLMQRTAGVEELRQTLWQFVSQLNKQAAPRR